MRPWDDIDDLTDIYINQVVYPDEDAELDDRHVVPRTDFVEMPRSIFVTQVPRSVFVETEVKAEFEALFPTAVKFGYFPNFQRVRVEFGESIEACRARVRFHLFAFHDTKFRVYLTNSVDSRDSSASMDYLKPPPAEKQFLISPPPSPPEGWVQIKEDKPSDLQPGLAFELISRLAALKTGESHEIIERTENHPSIILITCEDIDNQNKSDKSRTSQIQQTRRPEYQC